MKNKNRWILCFLIGLIPQFSPAYFSNPNHREIAIRAFELAIARGFRDSVITLQEIRDRLEAGAYSEDFEEIPGIQGIHFPDPWDQGPTFDFLGYIPISRIPYGSLVDQNRRSGWYRGLPHGYDPVQGFIWPGAETTTVAWANSPVNAYTWDNAIQLYRQGNKAEAYQCLGHVLHLLMDLSVPAHVRVVNHGVTNIRERDGTLHPDLADVIVDEYETALSGGLVVSGYQIIPNLLSEFRSALVAADSSRIPAYDNWSEYLLDLATFTYQRPRVVQFYQAPQVNGQFGRYLNDSGQTVDPQPFVPVPIPPGFVDGRFTQMFPLTTAQIPDGSILPESVMRELCDTLVPKATEYCAGLILHFLHEANQTTSVEYNGGNPVHYALAQNYPNPFNPSTTIRFTIPRPGLVTLRVYNVLGREVATLVNGDLSSGSYQVTFEASGLASGVYFYRLVTPGYVETKKMLLLK